MTHAKVDKETYLELINNVFLPPKLPQSAGQNCDIALLNLALQGVHKYKEGGADLPPEVRASINRALVLLNNLKHINSSTDSSIDKDRLSKSLCALQDGESLAMHVTAQNAAVIITRDDGKLVVEQFEVSPNNAAVYSTQGRLKRLFPATAVAISKECLDEPGFADSFADTMATLSSQPVDEMLPKSRKAKKEHVEIRDTARPGMVSDFVMSVLRGMGDVVEVNSIEKHTREEVLWQQALEPWRRAPMWLIIRATLQLLLCRSLGSDGIALYKTIMTLSLLQLTEDARYSSLPFDLQCAMRFKLSRRLHKLKASKIKLLPMLETSLAIIDKHIRRQRNRLSAEWAQIERSDGRQLDLAVLSTLDYANDTMMPLPELDKRIAVINSRSSKTDSPSYRPESHLIDVSDHQIPSLVGTGFQAGSEYLLANLQAVESWIFAHAGSWCTSGQVTEPWSHICRFMRSYHQLAKSAYNGNAEGMSIMFLALLKLWTVLDGAVVSHHPAFAKYEPELCLDIVQSFQLTSLEQLRCLDQIEAYVLARKDQSSKPLYDPQHANSFAHAFFKQSPSHQRLLEKIKTQQEAQRQQKADELGAKQERYNELNELYEDAECEYHQERTWNRWTHSWETETKHYQKRCHKCSLLRQRNALSIDNFEELLPRDEKAAVEMVFELAVPEFFAAWRTARSYLVFSVLGGACSKVSADEKSQHRLYSDPQLRSFYQKSFHDDAVGMASSPKPLSKSHYYKGVSVLGCTVQALTSEAAARYEYLDYSSSRPPMDTYTCDDTHPWSCTYSVPNKAIRHFAFRPAALPDGRSPNTVIAKQSTCPSDMSLEEFRDLCDLLLGRHLQWSKIILNLKMPTLDLKRADAVLIFWQCAHQTGPPTDSVLRQYHQVLQEDDLVDQLLIEVQATHERIKSNWESIPILSIVVMLALRVLEASFGDGCKAAFRDRALAILDSARGTANEWLSKVQQRLQSELTDQQRKDFHRKSCEIALLCACTFDVAQDDHLAVVLSRNTNVATLVEMSDIINRNKISLNLQSYFGLLHFRYQRLLGRAHHLLAAHHDGLNLAMQRIWAGFDGAGEWHSVSASGWVMQQCEVEQSQSCRVHVNLLTGLVLINGTRLGRLPQQYEQQPLYKTLFGDLVVDVAPSNVVGFEYSTKYTMFGFKVDLIMKTGTRDSAALTIRLSHKEHGTFESIDPGIFKSHLPRHFVNDFNHWLHVDKNKVYLVPSQDPWKLPSSDGWVMSSSPTGRWTVSQGSTDLIWLRTQSSKMLTGFLSPLAEDTDIHCKYDTSSIAKVRVYLQQYDKTFTTEVGSTELVSSDWRMHLDRSQYLGTLTGLENKLLLRSHDDGSRKVLIPQSSISYEPCGKHVKVRLNRQASTKILALPVQQALRRLQPPYQHSTILYLALLHALTSACLPDELSGCTGTEKALSLLQSGTVMSFEAISQKDISWLQAIAALAPTRTFYPAHLREMQSIRWPPTLGFFAQHEGFVQAVERILEHAQRIMVFHPDLSLQWPGGSQSDEWLLTRSLSRTSCIRTVTHGAEYSVGSLDAVHAHRDAVTHTVRADTVTSFVANFLRPDIGRLQDASPAGFLWDGLRTKQTVKGLQAVYSATRLRYDAALLSELHDHFDDLLPKLSAMINATKLDKFQILWWLAASAFAPNANLPLLETLSLFYKSGALSSIQRPHEDVYALGHGDRMQNAVLTSLVQSSERSYADSRTRLVTQKKDEPAHYYEERCQEAFSSKQQDVRSQAVGILAGQWQNSATSTLLAEEHAPYIKLTALKNAVDTRFRSWTINKELHDYLNKVVKVLNSIPCFHHTSPVAMTRLSLAKWSSAPLSFLSIDDIFSKAAPHISWPSHQLDAPWRHAPSKALKNEALKELIVDLRNEPSPTTHELAYTAELGRSQTALANRELPVQPEPGFLPLSVFQQYHRECQEAVDSAYSAIVQSLQLDCSIEELERGPRLTQEFILEQLCRTRWPHLDHAWRVCITKYGEALTRAQRATRLIQACTKDDGTLLAELVNVGHRNWKTMDFPDSLLIEIEAGILIREPQEEIAAQMRHPYEQRNVSMQMNMGEGKSSIIAPITVTALADGKKLVRIISGKAQAQQMADMLTSKIGGLVGRRLYRMPISRSLRLSPSAAENILAILQECAANGGVLLVQPEHLLSLQLMLAECTITKETELSKHLAVIIQLFSHARDLVDEADDIYSVDYELVYTMGEQTHIDFSPDRWIVMLELLAIVARVASKVQSTHASSIEIKSVQPAAFPRIRLLDQHVDTILAAAVADYIITSGLDSMPLHLQDNRTKQAVRTYILKMDLTDGEIAAVENSNYWCDDSKDTLLLLRGILAGGVLGFALHKRWRVNYGLTTDRTPATHLAVPFKAKDCPSLRADYSHTDVIIILTALSTYYGGLTDEQMFATFSHLVMQNSADMLYGLWIQSATGLPPFMQSLSGINLNDQAQCVGDVFPHLRYLKNVIDYYLCNLVFPREARVFPLILACSGWDLGQAKAELITGFSGTSDTSILLPLDMHKLELPAHKHTDALVLSNLLQPITGVKLMDLSDPTKSDTEELLQTIMHLQPPVQVILDVGAQILELNNRQLAETWLARHDTSKEAVIYVNDDDQICVLTRNGRSELWSLSHYQTNPDLCLVYLDEAHTRGIDIRLPTHYRAAVTLAPRLTKDKLMQACMRLRKLGHGQSVVFCVPWEVQSLILSATELSDRNLIGVKDVLRWVIKETHTAIRRNCPLWAMQGRRFYSQRQDWSEVINQTSEEDAYESAVALQERDGKTIEEMYRPSRSNDEKSFCLNEHVPEQRLILQRCQDIGNLSFDAASLQQEQERELAPEIQAEREVQSILAADPAKHALHPDVTAFAEHSVIKHNSTAYTAAFETLNNTSVSSLYQLSKLCKSRRLLATADFANTIKPRSGTLIADMYQRPVQWILVSRQPDGETADIMLLISPFEANLLFEGAVRGKFRSTLHIYKARANINFPSLHALDLKAVPNQTALTVPMSLVVELGLFSGQLFISSYAEYQAMCHRLGLFTGQLTDEMDKAGWKLDSNGFILCDDRQRAGGGSDLTVSPANFFRTFLTRLRRDGNAIARTQMARLLDGVALREDEFEN